MTDLFSQIPISSLPGTPLAEVLRPTGIDGILGQAEVVKQVQRYIQAKYLPNLILWGPPGTGKTSLATALAQNFSCEFVSINAVDSGVKNLKEIGEQAKLLRREQRRQTILFVDEIHRFNKSQQDVLLPFIEKGELVLIGATTENPSYELNRALLSRCRLLVFQRLSTTDLRKMLEVALLKENKSISISQLLSAGSLDYFLTWADGDARRMLIAFEELLTHWKAQSLSVVSAESFFQLPQLKEILGSMPIGYDKASDQHFDAISAFIKSIRGSDADAALYYLARMLKGGEDPLFIARRLVILASEDVGNADPRALSVAIAGVQAVELIGLPEAAINLAQVVTYCASAPKSNRSYLALKKAQDFVENSGTVDIPSSLRSAKTLEMKNLGYGKGYQYPHDHPKHWVSQNYWPSSLQPQKFYQPDEIGFEKQISEYLKWLKSEN